MSASANDKARLSSPNWSGALAASMLSTDTSLTLVSNASLPTGTGITLMIDATDSNGNPTPANKEVVNGVVGAGNTVTGLVRGQDGTTAKAHANAANVVMWFTSSMWNDLITAFIQEHSQLDGTHSSAAAATIASKLPAGSVAGTALAGGGVPFSALASNIFGGQVTHYTPTATVGNGSVSTTNGSCLNLGGLKLYWGGATGNNDASSTAHVTLTIPPSFFTSSLYLYLPTISSVGNAAHQFVSGDGFDGSHHGFYVQDFNGQGSNAGWTVNWLIIGS